MMITQSFLYNAIFFTTRWPSSNFFRILKQTPCLLLPVRDRQPARAAMLGRLFDSWGRRKMILLTYGGRGDPGCQRDPVPGDAMNAVTQVTFWCVAFFFASAGASSAYLTVSEIFPLEIGARPSRTSSRWPRSAARWRRCSSAC